MATLKENLRLWDEGVAACDRGEFRTALEKFTGIQDPSAKILFNIGTVQMALGQVQPAAKSFSSTLEKDEHLSVAYFQRGLANFKCGRDQEGLRDFQESYQRLRRNALIDYKQLGLRYKLCACEVLYNTALVHFKLGQTAQCKEMLLEAQKVKIEPRHNVIDKALECLDRHQTFQPIEMPSNVLFRPATSIIQNLEKKDYLGKAKVVSSITDRDDFSGFEPLRRPKESQAKSLDAALRPEGTPHRVVRDHAPNSAEELEVRVGNMVFVAAQEEGWCSVSFNNKIGLVPAVCLEEVEDKRGKGEEGRIRDSKVPEPPRSKPPQPPVRPSPPARLPPMLMPPKKALPTPPDEDSAFLPPSAPPNRAPPPLVRGSLAQGDNGFYDNEEAPISPPARPPPPRPPSLSADMPVVVKVHHTDSYTVAIRSKSGTSLRDLTVMVANKFEMAEDVVTLWYKKEGEEEMTEIVKDEDMREVWATVREGQLTLWLKDRKDDQESVSAMSMQFSKVVALHDYEASEPGDLGFMEGDVITIMSQVNEDWLEGRSRGNVGIFPAGYVKPWDKRLPKEGISCA
ncbi:neutrophil cytosol factor 2-like isoform X12 [Branchiostoma floridae x Branchiostoma belcheri]